MAHLLRMHLAAASEGDSSDDEEAQLSNNSSSQSSKSVQDRLSSLTLLAGDSSNDYDEEKEDASTRSPSFGAKKTQQPPQIIELPLPTIDGRAEDAQTIRSILGDIKDPDIRSALENIIKYPEKSRCSLINEPDPSRHSWGPTDILYDGLLYAGFSMDRLQKNNIDRKTEWFKSFYGVEHTTVAPFLADLRKEHPDIVYKDCFMTLNWLYLYETYPILTARWKCCEEYIGRVIIQCGLKMADLARKKIRFELEHDVELGRTIDCVTFMIQEMRQDPDSKWYDWKTHSAGLKYESCLATREPRITWISGPHEPSMHDITVFRGGDEKQAKEDRDQSALYFQLKRGEKLVGDSGYNGEPSKIVVTKDEQSREFKTFLARAKNRQETFHTRLKSFNILGQRFRHGVNPKERMRLHKMAMWAVAGIIQYDYENGHPPFEIC